MTVKVDNLWPEDFGVPKQVPPVTILRTQAALLGQRTKNIVEAEVKTAVSAPDEFMHSFNLVAPALDFYTYRLFFVTHGLALYPVKLTRIVKEVKLYPLINTAEELNTILQEIF